MVESALDLVENSIYGSKLLQRMRAYVKQLPAEDRAELTARIMRIEKNMKLLHTPK